MENWSGRDWKWLMGILLGVILLITTAWLSNIKDITNYFSFLGTGVSIVLALVAIYISLSQNNNAQILNTKTTDMLVRIDERIGSVNEKVDKIDSKEIAKFTETRVNAVLDKFSKTLFNNMEESGVDKQKIESLKAEIPVIKAKASAVQPTTKTNDNIYSEHIHKEVENVLNMIRDKSFSDSVGIINSTALTDEVRQILYKSLVTGPNKKPRDGNDNIYNALYEMYSILEHNLVG